MHLYQGPRKQLSKVAFVPMEDKTIAGMVSLDLDKRSDQVCWCPANVFDFFLGTTLLTVTVSLESAGDEGQICHLILSNDYHRCSGENEMAKACAGT
jgi:hypothetical protein